MHELQTSESWMHRHIWGFGKAVWVVCIWGFGSRSYCYAPAAETFAVMDPKRYAGFNVGQSPHTVCLASAHCGSGWESVCVYENEYKNLQEKKCNRWQIWQNLIIVFYSDATVSLAQRRCGEKEGVLRERGWSEVTWSVAVNNLGHCVSVLQSQHWLRAQTHR